MVKQLKDTEEHQAGMLEAADLVEEIAAWLRGENQDNFMNDPMRGPKTKAGWLQKAAREIRARAGVPQEGIWFTESEETSR